jgi:hypothetical protein
MGERAVSKEARSNNPFDFAKSIVWPCHPASPPVMLLAQSDKCRGFGGRAPKGRVTEEAKKCLSKSVGLPIMAPMKSKIIRPGAKLPREWIEKCVMQPNL